MKRIALTALAVLGAAVALTGCGADADVASHNLSKAADNFEIDRRVVFFNGITDKYLLVIEGRCSLGNKDTAKKLSVTCKVGDGEYKKHFLGLSDNVSYFVEQRESAKVSKDHYRVIFKPSTIIPDIDYRETSEGVDN
jgi:hypothetical protein